MQHGFALTESLITLFILSIGLLGLASLQLNAIKHQQESEFRLMAINQANAIADRMRANIAGAKSGAYNGLASQVSFSSCSICNAHQLAQKDRYEWNQDNMHYLPSGQGEIISLGGDLFEITIRWDNQKTGVTGTGCSGNPNIDLTCLKVRVQL